MPIIAKILKNNIEIYLNQPTKEHNWPHFHIYISGKSGSFFCDGTPYKGKFPAKINNRIKKWATDNQKHLQKNIRLLEEGKEVTKPIIEQK